MRLVILAVLAAGSVAFAQPRPGQTGAVGVFHGGAVVPPNVGSPAGSALSRGNGVHLRPGNSQRPWFAPPLMAHPQHGRSTVVYYPVFYGGYYYGYDPSVNGAPAPGYDTGAGYAAPSDSPVVVLSQSYRQEPLPPMARDYSDMPPPEPTMKVYDAAASEKAVVYLIAMKDHTIFPAVAYWVDGDTLNYVTTEGSPNRASLDLVDREFSRQLNDERHVEFKLPAVK